MERTNSGIAILGIGTALPAYRLDQGDTGRRLVDALADRPDEARWARRIFKQCGVERRYTCEPNLLAEAADCRYFPLASGESAPTTAERMAKYKQEAVPLGLRAARQALAEAGGDAGAVTHLMTVSCTGQFLPGMDAALVRELGLAPDVTRIPLTFIGCAAGLKAICLAKQLASGFRDALVLIVCVELCTLHIQPAGDRDSLFGASFFGDGASACVVGAAGDRQRPVFRLGDARSVLLEGGAGEMVWEVGNYGFDLYLSPAIPRLIGESIPAEIERLCGGEKPELWAIHPGGKGIIETLQSHYGLTDGQVAPSLGVLREIGNVSSATILFVLSAMREKLAADGSAGASGIALAFGPGLTAEMIKLDYVPSAPKRERLADGAYA
ncbi:type III polyketide synthase [Paenibacillus arenilitoris]|uniref:Type III polyketide synthase n=1 Tax=Paenibacillus arenilitoris TaxID=2772299 RepID=A0A927CP85_9BACL|nr:type III polyketide synthase [Paenibacillus arenilitoris]MBD2869441.1 type III polyketide synthase [Paenibacillus arenilitoris]